MITQRISRYTLSLITLLFTVFIVTCSTDNGIVGSESDAQTKKMVLVFEAIPPRFDSITTRAYEDWPDGARIYFQFENNGSGAIGTGTYAAATKQWTLSYTGNLVEGIGMSCQVLYFKDAVTETYTNATLSHNSCAYVDSTASYYLENGQLSVLANLHPICARLRFEGEPGTTLIVEGWPSCYNYALNNNTLLTSDSPISIRVNDDGYSPYFYGCITDTFSGNLRVTIDDDFYFRQMGPNTIKNGKSHVLTVPNDELVAQDKWYRNCRLFTVEGNDKTVTIKMIKVDGGTFQMGSDNGSDNEKPVHSVTITNGYYLGETEVTQELWYVVTGRTSGGSGADPYSWDKGRGDDYPAYYINCNEGENFIATLNDIMSSQLSSGECFRFPTAAEWEFAARGGNKSKGYIYSGSNNYEEVGWFSENSDKRTHPVKQKLPNELGLYDMSGNVCEWCYDWWEDYSSEALINPTGASEGTLREMRGNGYSSYAEGSSVSDRGNQYFAYHGNFIGLRLCLGTPIHR